MDKFLKSIIKEVMTITNMFTAT